MNNYKLVKNTEWKEVEINGDMREIPVDWEINTFEKEFVRWVDHRGISPKKVKDSTAIPLLTTKVVKLGYLEKPTEYITLSDYENRCKRGFLQKNDLIFTTEAPAGNVAIFKSDEKVALGQRMIALSSNGNNECFKYLLMSNYFKDIFEKISNGSTAQGITTKVLKDIDIFYPPIQTQSSIASILSEQESIIQDIESLISKYESLFEYLSDELLSGKLRVKEVDGEVILYKNPEDNWKEVVINGEVKEISKDWTFDKIDGFIVENNKSKIKAGDLKKLGSFPAFNCSKELSYFYNDYLLDNENLFLSTGGQAAIHYYNGKSAYSTDVYSIKGKGNINNKFLFLMLKNGINTINKMFYGAGLKHLNKKEFKSSDWAIPMKEEQKLISFVLSEQEDLVEQKNTYIRG